MPLVPANRMRVSSRPTGTPKAGDVVRGRVMMHRPECAGLYEVEETGTYNPCLCLCRLFVPYREVQ